MDLELFEIICHVSLGVAAFGMLLFGLGLAIRATARQEDAALKWEALRALADAEKHLNCPQSRDDRIQTSNKQTQRGDAS